MQLVPIKSLPNIETEPSTDWALVSHQKNELKLNYLAFAVKRDFLSTPRTYAILSLKETPEKQLKTNEFLLADYLDNKGGVLSKFKVKENLSDAQVKDGMVWIGHPKVFGSIFLPTKRWHYAEYNLFYLNIRENAQLRAKTFLEKN